MAPASGAVAKLNVAGKPVASMVVERRRQWPPGKIDAGDGKDRRERFRIGADRASKRERVVAPSPAPSTWPASGERPEGSNQNGAVVPCMALEKGDDGGEVMVRRTTPADRK